MVRMGVMNIITVSIKLKTPASDDDELRALLMKNSRLRTSIYEPKYI
jgi:hypothetical protein